MCSVRDILLATKQGAFESVFGTFSVRGPGSGGRGLWKGWGARGSVRRHMATRGGGHDGGQ